MKFMCLVYNDDAVLRAIDKTEVLPRDTDGRVPSSFEISFRPRD